METAYYPCSSPQTILLLLRLFLKAMARVTLVTMNSDGPTPGIFMLGSRLQKLPPFFNFRELSVVNTTYYFFSILRIFRSKACMYSCLLMCLCFQSRNNILTLNWIHASDGSAFEKSGQKVYSLSSQDYKNQNSEIFPYRVVTVPKKKKKSKKKSTDIFLGIREQSSDRSTTN